MAVSHRVVPIAAAYVASCFVASVVFVIALGWGGGAGDWSSAWAQVDLGLVQAFLSLAALVGGLVAVLALLPTLVVGIYTERNRVRSPLFYAVAGAMVGLAALGLYVAVLLWNAAPGDTISLGEGEQSLKGFLAGVVALVAGAGVLSGLTYWAIAGRKAG